MLKTNPKTRLIYHLQYRTTICLKGRLMKKVDVPFVPEGPESTPEYINCFIQKADCFTTDLCFR